ncbi:MAG TPA: hypothetical protein VMT00_16720 [Thermoanaerobaculia bacterium]|nr:hypothetical protein [Thermoanaerobaculia bacterium]
MSGPMARIEELRREALIRLRANRIEEAFPLLDEAMSLATDEATRELLTIDRAQALILLERTGPEVQQLPAIIMRRRSAGHVYRAAYHLQYHFQNEKNYKRAQSYALIALGAAEEAGNAEWIREVKFALGNLAVLESRTSEAIDYYEAIFDEFPDNAEHRIWRAFTLQNLGYSRMMNDEVARGIELIHRALEMMVACGAAGYAAESYVDLCFGYLELGDLDAAERYGELGLAEATETRQVRNAHYLLGEVAYKKGDTAKAESHFEHLATFYPDFPQLKNLLLAIDLRGLVNLKL